MSKIHHLFVIDPIEKLTLKLDSSLRIAKALANTGHSVHVCTANQLEWLSREPCAAVWSQELSWRGLDIDTLQTAPTKRLRLDFFRAIHMRRDPPYDMSYITTTWLLDSALKRGVKVFNSPAALRNLNEKISIFRFPELIRAGILSSNSSQLLDFIKTSCKGDAILKPLTLYGGRGVQRLNLAEQSEDEILKVLQLETENDQDLRLVQPFDARVFAGEVRAFTCSGRAVAWSLKKPSADNFLANTRLGATLEKYNPRPEEVLAVENVAKDLLSEGVFFIGFDLIAGNISEINITSPRLLHAAVDTHDYYRDIAEILISELS